MSRRATLAAQLAQLHSTGPSFDPDAADHLDGLPTRRNGDTADDATDSVDRDHYLDVGPSRLRGAIGAERPLGERYEGKVRGRQKIFEDDDDESEAEQAELGPDGELEEQSEGDEEDDDEEKEEEEMGNDDADESSGDEEEDEEEEDDLDGDEEDDGEDGEDEEDQDEAVLNQSRPTASKLPSGAPKALDPVAALRDSRQKDVLKGQAIRRQRALFESLLTIRITYQKALTALSKLPIPLSESNAEVAEARAGVMSSLSELNEAMFAMRRGITLTAEPVPESIGKRKRAEAEGDVDLADGSYWVDSAKSSLALSDAAKQDMLPILTKWSTKIQAATLAVGGKAAGSSKFLQGTKGTTGVVEAIEAGLAGKRNIGARPILELEEPHYRSLLREIIDTRSASASNLNSAPSAYRLEKKKKRDAERGASKGRKIRYTVHEKAANFAVPVALELIGGWGEERVDELFGSLMGGVGMRGVRSEGGGAGVLSRVEGLDASVDVGVNGARQEGLVGLGGLKVF